MIKIALITIAVKQVCFGNVRCKGENVKAEGYQVDREKCVDKAVEIPTRSGQGRWLCGQTFQVVPFS
jgi:hypothetical protein